MKRIAKSVKASNIIFWEDVEKMDEATLTNEINSVLSEMRERIDIAVNREVDILDIVYLRRNIEWLEDAVHLLEDKKEDRIENEKNNAYLKSI